MNAHNLLARASELIDRRGREYDKPGGERSMAAAVAALNAITGRGLSESEGWLLLQLLKDVRQWQRPAYHKDSAEDCVAYAALKAEARAREHNEDYGDCDTCGQWSELSEGVCVACRKRYEMK